MISLKKKKKKTKRGCSLIRACSLIRSNTVFSSVAIRIHTDSQMLLNIIYNLYELWLQHIDWQKHLDTPMSVVSVNLPPVHTTTMGQTG